MPLSEINKAESQSIEDLIAQLEPQQQATSGAIAIDSNNSRKMLKGKRTNSTSNTNGASSVASSAPASSFMRQASFGLNSEPVLSKNIITSKKYTKHSNSRTGATLKGLPKKNGAGGKYTWGAPGCELVDYLDPNDPNYDSGEDPGNVVMVCLENSDGEKGRSSGGGGMNTANSDADCIGDSRSDLKELDVDELEQEIKPVILEYFQNGDTIEVIDHLKCYKFYKLKAHLIAYLLQLALEHNNTCKELTSRLLRDFTLELFAERDFVRGFDLVLKNLPDLILDNPDASEKLGMFLARAIADKAISKSYLDRFWQDGVQDEDVENMNADRRDLLVELRQSEQVLKAVEGARVLVNMHNHLYHLSHIWGNKGGFLAVKELTDKINEIIQEYHDSGDVSEAIRCLKELNVPHFHHEFVFEALDYALQKGNDQSIDVITTLLHRLCESVVVTYDQLKIVSSLMNQTSTLLILLFFLKGIVRILDILPDISLDVPNASNLMDKILTKCYSKGFIGENILEMAPNR